MAERRNGGLVPSPDDSRSPAMTGASRPRGLMAKIVFDVVRTILPRYPELDPDASAAVEADVASYVGAQIASMPAFLRLPYQLALLAFAWLPVVRHGRPFGRLSPMARAAYLGAWSDGPIAPLRDVVKLMRSSALLVYFDHPLVVERLEAERPPRSSCSAPHA